MKKAREYTTCKAIGEIKLTGKPGIKGSFLIGYVNPETNKFRPRYVGVSFTNLLAEIIESSKKTENKNFDSYRLVKTNKEAWELECKTYHEFKECNNLTNGWHSKWPNEHDLIESSCPQKDCNNE
jgi:hypothetical protein